MKKSSTWMLNKKEKGKKTRLKTDLEFRQKKIFDLNKIYIVDMFLTVVRGGNAFAVEQKIKELKKEYLELSRWKKHGSGKKTI